MSRLVCLFLLVFPALAHAQASPTIPDVGVNVGNWVTAAITGLGAIVVVVVGGYFAFKLIKLAKGWIAELDDHKRRMAELEAEQDAWWEEHVRPRDGD